MSQDIWRQLEAIRQECQPKINVTHELMQALIDEHTAVLEERDELVARVNAAESLAIEWQHRHADLYIASEETRNRANDAEGKLIVLQDLLRKATRIAGGDNPKYWRNK